MKNLCILTLLSLSLVCFTSSKNLPLADLPSREIVAKQPSTGVSPYVGPGQQGQQTTEYCNETYWIAFNRVTQQYGYPAGTNRNNIPIEIQLIAKKIADPAFEACLAGPNGL